MKRAGRRLRTEHLEVRASDSLLSHGRVSIIVGKHGHTIVERNRLRRRLREIVRTRVIPAASKLDIVIRTMPSAYQVSYRDLQVEVESILPELTKQDDKR